MCAQPRSLSRSRHAACSRTPLSVFSDFKCYTGVCADALATTTSYSRRRLDGTHALESPPSPPSPLPPGVGLFAYSIWVSDTPHIKGDRAARVDSGTERRRNVVAIGPDENGYPFVGRFWTLQSYALDEKLRIDGFRLWGVAPSPPSPPPLQPPSSPLPQTPPSLPALGLGGFHTSELGRNVASATPYTATGANPAVPTGAYIWPSSSSSSLGVIVPEEQMAACRQPIVTGWCAREHCAQRCADQRTPTACNYFSRFVDGSDRVCNYYSGVAVFTPATDAQLLDSAAQPSEFYTIDVHEVVRDTGRRRLEEKHQPQSHAEADDPTALHWWNRLETFPGRLYPYRNMPGTDSTMATAAGSLAVALSLFNASDVGMPDARKGQNATILRVCEQLNCTEAGRAAYSAWVYEQPHVDDFARDVWVHDDLLHVVWMISAMVEHAVHVVYAQALVCVSSDLCGDKCAGCPPQMRAVPDISAEELVRTVEAALGGAETKTRDPLDCVRDGGCLEEIAHEVARRAGAEWAAPAPFELVASANDALFRGFVTDHDYDEPFNETLFRRHALARRHANELTECCSTPTEWAVGEGNRDRRLQEEEPPRDRVVPRAVAVMYSLTAAVCAQLNASNITGTANALYTATRQWGLLGGEGNSKTNPNEQFCSDCNRVNHTQACNAFFSLSASRLNRLRLRQYTMGAGAKAKRRKLVEESVARQAQELCCARFEDGRPDDCAPKWCGFVVKNATAMRMAKIGRRLYETNHSTAHHLTTDARTGIDYLDPENHVDPDCRPANKIRLGLSEVECFGRSMVKLGDPNRVSI